jgi:hypothetical protein
MTAVLYLKVRFMGKEPERTIDDHIDDFDAIGVL